MCVVELQCSYSVCLKKLEDNKRAVEEFAEQWRARGYSETFECFYDTVDPSRVIVEKMYTINDVIHSMTWPSLVVVICGLVFLRLKTLRRLPRRHHRLCSRSPRATASADHESSIGRTNVRDNLCNVFLRLQTRRHKLTLCGRRSTSSPQASSADVMKQSLRQKQQQQQQHEERYNEDHCHRTCSSVCLSYDAVHYGLPIHPTASV